MRTGVFLLMVFIWICNRFLFPGVIPFHSWISDFIAIPVFSFFATISIRKMHNHHFIPSPVQVIWAALIFSIWFEGIMPLRDARFTADGWDVLCYFAGAGCWIRFPFLFFRNEAATES
ncbi:MAG: hypothetical protein K1X56_10875 [Flavobacteriales bacterium]|nr:hypothetical protein [Flavobacteriales bacterium]